MSIQSLLILAVLPFVSAPPTDPVATNAAPAVSSPASCWLANAQSEKRDGVMWVIETWQCSDGSWYTKEYPSYKPAGAR